MKIEKIKSTPEKPNWNTYRAELSFGQLIAMRDALAKDHANPVADEMYQELNFFLDALPKPGEEIDKDSKEAVGTSTRPAGADELDSLDIDKELPMPGEEDDIAAGPLADEEGPG